MKIEIDQSGKIKS